MAYAEVIKDDIGTGGSGGKSGIEGISGTGGYQDGGGTDSGAGTDFTYYNVTSDTTMGGSGSNPGASDTPVLTLPDTVSVRDNKGCVVQITIGTASSATGSAVPLFAEFSHDGTNWTEHNGTGSVNNTTINASLPTTTTGTHTYWLDLNNCNFPRFRVGFNSNGQNLNGMVFNMAVTFIDDWVDPAKYRKWNALQGE